MPVTKKWRDDAKIAEQWLSRGEVAEYLNVPARTLDTWAYKGIGPKYSKMGRYTRYRLSDIEKWADEQAKGGAA